MNDSADGLQLYESRSVEFGGLMEEIMVVDPHVILLEESSPFSEDSTLMRLLLGKPGLPVIVIGEDSNLMHIVHLERKLLSSSNDLIKAITLI